MNERQRQLRDEFVAARGYWSDVWESVLALDTDFFETYLHLSSVPWRTGRLEPKVKEFVYIAIDGAATHLYEPGLRIHIRKALEYGATKEELVEVFQLTSTLGIHASTVGVPILLEAMGDAPLPARDERREALRADFVAKRGYWHEFWDGMLALDPDFFQAYLDFSSLPWSQGVLEPKVKELIYIAFDASATHMYIPGLKQHVENALALGAAPEEIMEVFEIASVIGIHTCTVGVPILIEELERAGIEWR